MEAPVNIKHPGGRPLKYTPDYMSSRLTEYISECEADKRPITITGFCQYIGTNRETLGDYKDRDEYSDIIKRLRGAAENCLVDVMLSGKNPAGAIFLAKNHFDYSDKQTVEHTGNIIHSLSPMSLEQIELAVQRRRALESAAIEAEVISAKTEPIPVAIPVDAEESTD